MGNVCAERLLMGSTDRAPAGTMARKAANQVATIGIGKNSFHLIRLDGLLGSTIGFRKESAVVVA